MLYCLNYTRFLESGPFFYKLGKDQLNKIRKIESLESEIASNIGELMEIRKLSNTGLAEKVAHRLGLTKQTLTDKIAYIRIGRSLPFPKNMNKKKLLNYTLISNPNERIITLDRVSVLLYALGYMETDNLVCELREMYDEFTYPPPKERPYKLKKTRRKD